MKLTKPQMDLLETISWHPNGRLVRNLHFTYAPMRRLIAKRAVERGTGRHGWALFKITDAGRAALRDAEEGGE